jgi:N4-(beta-N-acetylglucosaminyl)-L-asparaginase
VTPYPKNKCGPYQSQSILTENHQKELITRREAYSGYYVDNHDTIGMIAIDQSGNVSTGTSTNGLTHKVPGYVGKN